LSYKKILAYESIKTARYNGRSNRYGFDAYVATHQKAHNELLALGEPVAETKKVNDFLAGITAQNLSMAKLVIQGDNDKKDHFEACQQYLKGVCQNLRVSDPSDTRNVSGVGYSNASAGGRNNNNKDKRRSNSTDKKGGGNKRGSNKKPRVHGGHHEKDAWAKLSQAEKDQCLALRAAKKNNPKISQVTTETNEDRKVSSLASVPPQVLTASPSWRDELPRKTVALPTWGDRKAAAVVTRTNPRNVDQRPAWLARMKPPPTAASAPDVKALKKAPGSWKDKRDAAKALVATPPSTIKAAPVSTWRTPRDRAVTPAVAPTPVQTPPVALPLTTVSAVAMLPVAALPQPNPTSSPTVDLTQIQTRDQEIARLLAPGKPAWYKQAAAMACYMPLSVNETHEPSVAISSVRTTSARGNLKVPDDEEDDWDVVEATADAVDNVVAKVVENVPGTYVTIKEFMSEPFGRRIDAFVKRIEYRTTHRWTRGLNTLFSSGNEARRWQHNRTGNTTYPCPMDLETFLKPRPATLRMINPDGFEERSFPRSLDLESEDSFEAADLTDLTEDQVENRDWARYMSKGREHNRRYRMP
jgi:hypothetical protein